jgi:hypothetical protein
MHLTRARIRKRLWSPGIDSDRQARLLGSLKGLQIRAQLHLSYTLGLQRNYVSPVTNTLPLEMVFLAF